MSIVRKIFLGVVVVQIVTAALIIGWFFYSVRPEIKNLVVQNAQETVIRSVAATEEFFGPVETAIQAAQYLISRQVLQRDRPEQLVRYLHDQLRLWPQFAGLYIGYPDGAFYYVMRDDQDSANGTRTKIIGFPDSQREVMLTWRDAEYSTIRTIADPDDVFDPRARPWYHAALEKSDVIWTDPYIFFTSGKPGITAAVAVGSGSDKPVAVLGIDIEIDKLSDYLKQIAFGSQRTAFVVSSDGEIFSHSDIVTVLSGELTDDGKPRFLNLTELDNIKPSIRDGIVARVSDTSAADAQAVWQEQSGDGNHIIAVGRIASANWPWNIVAIFPETDIIGISSGSDLSLIGIALLATALAIAIGYILAQSIGRPLTVLRNNANMARNGNIELMEEVNSGYDEINGTAVVLAELGEMRRNRGTSAASKSRAGKSDAG